MNVAPLAIAGDRVNRECYPCAQLPPWCLFVSLDFKPYVTPEGSRVVFINKCGMLLEFFSEQEFLQIFVHDQSY